MKIGAMTVEQQGIKTPRPPKSPEGGLPDDLTQRRGGAEILNPFRR